MSTSIERFPVTINQTTSQGIVPLTLSGRHADRFEEVHALATGENAPQAQFLAALVIDDLNPLENESLIAKAQLLDESDKYLRQLMGFTPVVMLGRTGVSAGIADTEEGCLIIKDVASTCDTSSKVIIPTYKSTFEARLDNSDLSCSSFTGRINARGTIAAIMPDLILTPTNFDEVLGQVDPNHDIARGSSMATGVDATKALFEALESVSDQIQPVMRKVIAMTKPLLTIV